MKRPKLHRKVEKIAHRFVELARQIPEVQLILYEEESTGERSIFTVIDAPRFEDAYRHKVYNSQRAALDGVAESPVDFRLTNMRESHQSIDYFVRGDELLMYRREATA